MKKKQFFSIFSRQLFGSEKLSAAEIFPQGKLQPWATT